MWKSHIGCVATVVPGKFYSHFCMDNKQTGRFSLTLNIKNFNNKIRVSEFWGKHWFQSFDMLTNIGKWYLRTSEKVYFHGSIRLSDWKYPMFSYQWKTCHHLHMVHQDLDVVAWCSGLQHVTPDAHHLGVPYTNHNLYQQASFFSISTQYSLSCWTLSSACRKLSFHLNRSYPIAWAV